MKKFLLLTLPLIIILSGCAFFSQEEEVPAGTEEEKKMEKYIGIITTPQDLSETNAATSFILLMESGEKISIDSLNVNLKKYVKRRVEVEGKYSDSGAIFDVISVTSLGQETQQKQPYQNPLLGLKFQYPSVWILKEELSVLGIAKIIITPYEVEADELANVDIITIERSENNRKLSPREWLGLDELYRPIGEGDGNALYQQSFLGSAQLDSVKVTNESQTEVKFFTARDTFMYQFSHISVNDSDKDLYQNAFYDLVQSFEFIPFGDVVPEAPPTQPEKQPTPPHAPSATNSSKTLSELAEEEMAVKKAEEAMKKAEEEAREKLEDKATLRQRLISYVGIILGQLAPEAPTSGATWSILNVDLAFPEGEPDNIKGMYVTYSDGTDGRRILLSVTLFSTSAGDTPPAQVEQIAYFKPGETTDWQLISGTDTMKSLEKVRIVVSGESREIPIKKGMAFLDARSFKIKIQYPASWYWAFRSTGYSFSNKPVSGENVLLHLTKNPEILPENMSSIGELGAKPATKGEMAEAMSVCVQVTEKYCLSGDPSYEETMRSMLETLTE